MSTSTDRFESGVLSSLTDFGFTRYATPRLIRILYVISFVLILLGGLVFFVLLVQEGGAGVVLGLIGVPLYAFLLLLYARVGAELLSILFRIGHNSELLVQLARGGPAAPVAPGGPGGPPAHGGPPPTGPLGDVPPPTGPPAAGPPPSGPPAGSL